MSDFYLEFYRRYYDSIENLSARALAAGFASWLSARQNSGFWQVQGLREWRHQNAFQRVVSDNYSYRIPMPKVKAVMRWRWQ